MKMGYFEDVYSKRANKRGNSRAEVRKNRAAYEFENLFLKRTMYYCTITQLNGEELDEVIDGSLQVSKRDETKQISNLLTRLENLLELGDQVKIKQEIGTTIVEKLWLVLFKEEDISKGYNKYRVICLDDTINISDRYGEIIKVQPIKILTTMGKFFEDYFKFTSIAYREPNTNFVLLTKDNNLLKKELYFELKNFGYEFTFINRTAIQNVAYCSFRQKLLRSDEPDENKNKIETPNQTDFFLNNMGGG